MLTLIFNRIGGGKKHCFTSNNCFGRCRKSRGAGWSQENQNALFFLLTGEYGFGCRSSAIPSGTSISVGLVDQSLGNLMK